MMQARPPNPTEQTIVVFGIGLNLCSLFSPDQPERTADIFTRIINTQSWYDFETGKASQEETYNSLAQYLNINVDDIQGVITLALKSFPIGDEVFELIRAIKPGHKAYAMLNIPMPVWDIVEANNPQKWKHFDRVFLSATVGNRKPKISFFHHVIKETGANHERILFVDDQFENLVAARSLGFKTIRWDNFADTKRLVYNRCGDTVARANAYLLKHAKKHRSEPSLSTAGRSESFTQLMLLEATNDLSLVELVDYEGEWNMFQESGNITPEKYPDDLDTTSMAWTVLPNLVPENVKKQVMDRIIEFLDDEGIPFTYFDKNRHRRDHEVCANVVTLFFSNGRGEELGKALEFLESLLQSGAYVEGSRYYRSPEIFLYFMLRLLERAPSLHHRIGDVLKKRCRERIGCFLENNPLALGMRLHCCNRLDIDARVDFERLLDLQQLDGSWDGGRIFSYGMREVHVSNKALTTAIAQRAIKEYRAKFHTEGSIFLVAYAV